MTTLARNRSSFSCEPQWSDWLCVDVRSAGALRVSIGLLLVAHAFEHLQLYSDLYSPWGVLPSTDLAQSREIPPFPSLLSWLERFPWGFQAFLIATAISYVALTVGWHTRFATVSSLFVFSTICHRNPYLVMGSDELIGSMLLWSCLLPLDARFSVDEWRTRKRNRIISSASTRAKLASLGVLIQLSMVYFATAWQKVGATWWADGTALDRILGLNTFRLPGAKILESLPPGILPILSRAVLLIEYAIPVLILNPCLQPLGRRLAIGCIVGLHVGIACTIETGLFSLTMIAMTPLLLTSTDWDTLESFAHRLGWSRTGDVEGHLTARSRTWKNSLFELTAVFLFLGFIQENWNRSFAPTNAKFSSATLAFPWRFAAAAQRWSMFAPDPPLRDPQIAVRVVRPDRSTVTVWSNQPAAVGHPTRFTPPKFLWKLFMLRTSVLLDDERRDEGQCLRASTCEFFARSWLHRQPSRNLENAHIDSSIDVERVEIWVTFIPTHRRSSDLMHETACVASHEVLGTIIE